jgi:XTP/dITP diphosphohydrolase
VTIDKQEDPRADIQGARFSSAGSGSSHVTRHMSLFLASSNPGKLREFSEAAALRKVTVQPVPGFAKLPICVEDGTTFEENARRKAIHYSQGCAEWVFADDSGICVDALGGAPGIYSARFAGPEATDEQNNQRLLADLREVEARRRAQALHTPGPHRPFNRAAHYICAIALAQAGQVLAVVAGRVDGVIIDDPRGSGGFGYDPYFFYPPLGKTLAEINPEDKFAVSHRGAAFRNLLDYLCTRGL